MQHGVGSDLLGAGRKRPPGQLPEGGRTGGRGHGSGWKRDRICDYGQRWTEAWLFVL